MQSVKRTRIVGLGLAALLTISAALTTTAPFQSPAPGADLEPRGNAASLISLVQGTESLLWSSMSGTVNSYTVLGWPVSKGDVELGGALVMERPDDGSAGVIDFGEKPMKVIFDLED